MEAAHTYWISETAGVLDLPGPATLDRQRRIWWLAGQFRARPGVREVVPGMNNLTVELEAPIPDPETLLEALLDAWHRSEDATVAGRRFEIPVQYGGPDLDEVSRHTGLSRREIVRLHSGAQYTVFFLGFLPGFAYLGGMDRRLATPRRKVPRAAVPAGSVAIGGEQTGIFPLASPGGWQIIGATTLKLFDPGREPQSLLMPGDIVRFVQVGEPG